MVLLVVWGVGWDLFAGEGVRDEADEHNETVRAGR